MKKSLKQSAAALMCCLVLAAISSCRSGVEKEFYGILDNPSCFPVSFVYDGVQYNGLGDFKFKSRSFSRDRRRRCRTAELEFTHPDGRLAVKIKAAVYPGYNACDWTLFFTNVSDDTTGVLSGINAADFVFKGANPAFRGCSGDACGHYTPIERELLDSAFVLNSASGMDSVEYLPYFDVATDGLGATMALGWPGTWKACFVPEDGGVRFMGSGVPYFNTYLAPGETYRSPLMAFVFHSGRDTDSQINNWRRWMVECNMPAMDAAGKEPFKALTTIGFVSDCGKGWYTGGSESENSQTWRRSLDAVRKHDVHPDFHWFDAGWYYGVDSTSLVDVEWYNVGSWTVDERKWPGNSLKEYTTAMKDELGVRGTVMWFETERMCGLPEDWERFGGKREWLLSNIRPPWIPGNYPVWLVNHSTAEAQDFLFDKITTAMEKGGIYAYREDSNAFPLPPCTTGDELCGGRPGITENLHFQGKFALWDRILQWQKQTGRAGFIEMQSSGGNRQNLEFLRRAVSFFRSDSDAILDPPYTVSKLNSINKWIPFGGLLFGRVAGSDEQNPRNLYQWRSCYCSQLCLEMQFQNLSDSTWTLVENGLKEFDRYKQFVLKDFYELTPVKENHDESHWVSREYLDPESGCGVLETFRFKDCPESSLRVCLKGLDPDATYVLEDPDGINGSGRVSGKSLMEGCTVSLEPCSSSLLWINRIK